ncbi:MAG: DUF6800 family protein [Gemmataceae bacterium]
MVERRIELGRRYHRKAKMMKLKKKLATATGADREKILYKITRLSPMWTEESLKQAEAALAGTEMAKAAPKEPKKKAPVKKKS